MLASTVQAYGAPDLPVISNQTFAVTNSAFGAVGNGTTNNAAAISNAVAFVASHGGGTVLIPSNGSLSTFLSGPFPLASGVNLQIDTGATLKMLSFSVYPTNPVIPDFISGTGLHDVEISGSGTIDGSAANGTPGWWDGRATSARPLMIMLSICQRVLIQNLHLKNPPKMHIGFKGTGGNITIQGITINTPVSPNTDGIDLAGTNCLVQNCSISDGDDNIAFSPTVGTVTSDILVTNCTFGIGHGVSIGSNTAGGLSNLTVTACSFSGTDYGIRMKSDNNTNTGGTVNGRGGLVQNLSYSNLTMTNITRGAIVIYSYYNEVGTPTSITPFGASTQAVDSILLPVWRNITISNVTATVGSSGISGIIWGRKEMVVSNVTLSKINISGPNPFCIYNAGDIRLLDCQYTIPGTNILNLYNAGVTITNTAFTTNLVTLGGLATPPTNNLLTIFNAQATITDTNMLGTGPITLSGSTLTFSQNSVNSSNSNIAVLAGSTLIFTGGVNVINGTLSGSGVVRGSVTMNGTLAPGPSPGTLTFSDDLTLNAAATLLYDLGTNSDLTVANGSLTLSGTLNINDAGGFSAGVYTLLTYGGALTDNGASIGTTPNPNFSYTIDTSTAGQVRLIVNHIVSVILADAGNLSDRFGNLAPAASVAVLVADTGNNGFTDPQPSFPLSLGATWGTDDKVVGLWNLMAAYPAEGDGQLLDQTVVAYTNGIAAGQKLQLYWFPSLTLASNTVGATYYGRYTDTNNPALDGSDAWQIPAGGMNVRLRFWTTFWGGSNPESAGWATLFTTVPTAFESWQIQYFGDTNNPAAAASADPDGDGMSNMAEFLAGTDPTNSASFFGITGITAENNDIRVTWMTGTGRTNALERSAGDAGGSYSTNFATIFTVTNTLGTTTNYLDVGAATNTPSRFYRVRLVP